MQGKLELTVPESIAFAQKQAYWDGYAAGCAATAAHAKDMMIQDLERTRKPTPPPAQPEPAPEA